jgi:ADP-ribose pyrophosphatase YjhB (NUDIX family)
VLRPKDLRDEELCRNEWLSLWRLVVPSMGIGGYVYSHETRCNGVIVAALPYRFVRRHTGRLGRVAEFLLRVEVTPCWSLRPVPSAVTGGLDRDDPSVHVAISRELREETGYDVPAHRLFELGRSFGTKSTDTDYWLFAADVTGLDPGPLQGDGSALEDSAGVQWTERPWESADPIVATMWARLVHSKQWAEAH